MSRPPVFPEQSASGIAVDPRTLERVVPESRRADGTWVLPGLVDVELTLDVWVTESEKS